MTVDVDSIIQSILQSKKYRDIELCEETVRDLLHGELKHHKNTKSAIKATRKKLHRIVATYLGDPDYAEAMQELTNAAQTDTLEGACTMLMQFHASTKERLKILDSFYATLFAHTGPPATILDIACGLNPLSFRWMRLPTTTRYYAYDIHQQRVDCINHYFMLEGLLPLAKMQDILVYYPQEQADVALVLKEIHTFERRKRGSSLALFNALNVRYIVATLPTRNLTGRRDREEYHRQLFYGIVDQMPWKITEISFENEMVFCIDKHTICTA